MKRISLIGAASGWGAQVRQTEQGPDVVQALGLENVLIQKGIDAYWRTIVRPSQTSKDIDIEDPKDAIYLVNEQNKRLANIVRQTLKEGEFPVVIGGDHSIAVGNWSAIIQEKDSAENFGLIWIDAHMDAHTHETTPSNAYHGMPVAALMGYGEDSFVNVVSKGPKIKPENVVLMGVRAYEPEEESLLQKLNVRIMYMDEVKGKGFETLLKEAISIATNGTKGFGVSIDLDAFDPKLAPGVGSPEVDGLIPAQVIPYLKLFKNEPKFQGLEITELNPDRDEDNMTAALIKDILLSVF